MSKNSKRGAHIAIFCINEKGITISSVVENNKNKIHGGGEEEGEAPVDTIIREVCKEESEGRVSKEMLQMLLRDSIVLVVRKTIEHNAIVDITHMKRLNILRVEHPRYTDIDLDQTESIVWCLCVTEQEKQHVLPTHFKHFIDLTSLVDYHREIAFSVIPFLYDTWRL